MSEDAKNFPKIDPNDCTHTGYYVGFGFDSYQLNTGFLILSAIICMRCGKKWYDMKTFSLQTPTEGSKIATQ